MNISLLISQMLESPDDKELRKEVENEILKLSYFIPQRRFGLREEDAGDFVLEISSMVDEIFSKYRPESSSFMTYLYLVLEHGVHRFYKRKKESVLLEYAAVLDYAPFDSTDLETIMEERKMTEKKVKNAIMKKLYYTFTRIPDYRRKFYILALSFLPLMEYTSIAGVCRTFRYDLKQTVRLCTEIRSKCMGKISYRDNLETMRNVWWTKVLAGRNLMAAEKSMDLYKQKFDNRIQDLEKYSPKVPYKYIAEQLGMKERTVSNISRELRAYLVWLMDGCKILPDSAFENKELSRRLYLDMRKAKWRDATCRWEELPVIVPSDTFRCSLFTEHNK